MRNAETPARPGLDRDGFEIVPSVCDSAACEALISALERFMNDRPARSASRRNLLQDVKEVFTVATRGAVHTLVNRRFQVRVEPVCAILFDKTPEANWPVTWHQDQIVAVAERIEVEGFAAWSVKEGVPHVRPPARILDGMITARLHLDDCRAANGALQVLPGSHRAGLLDEEAIGQWIRRVPPRLCEVARGGVLLMKPLLLHASQVSTQAGHRRVLHIEYAADTLPGGLRWPVHAELGTR